MVDVRLLLASSSAPPHEEVSQHARKRTLQICPQRGRGVLRKARLDNTRRRINTFGREALSPSSCDDAAAHLHTPAEPAKAWQHALECGYPPRAVAMGSSAIIPRRGVVTGAEVQSTKYPRSRVEAASVSETPKETRQANARQLWRPNNAVRPGNS
jgi:hypothetical protein